MNRSRLLLGVSSTLAGIAVVLAILGILINPVFLVVAAPFGVTAYFLWSDATGRLWERMRRDVVRGDRSNAAGRGARRGRSRFAREARSDGQGKRVGNDAGPRDIASRTDTMSRAEARDVLGVDVDADPDTVKRAYRERVKEVHPDREGGDEETFKRVADAYDRLTESTIESGEDRTSSI